MMVANSEQVKVSDEADFCVFNVTLARLPVIPLIPECEDCRSELQGSIPIGLQDLVVLSCHV